jgi:hypothetical protein
MTYKSYLLIYGREFIVNFNDIIKKNKLKIVAKNDEHFFLNVKG